MLIILLLAIPAVIRFEYGSGLYLKARYLFITLYKIPAKPKKRKKSKKNKKTKSEKAAAKQGNIAEKQPEKTSDSAEDTAKEQEKAAKEKNPKVPTLAEILELVKAFVDSLGKPLKKLLKRITISDFSLVMVCGGSDAARAALKFGAVNYAVGNALGWLGSFFTIKEPHIDINVDFQSEQTTTQCSCTIRLSALVLLIFVFNFLFRLILRALRSDRIMAYLKRIKGSGEKKKK